MADRYWVGGTDTWNATAGTKWATASGGAGGASVPTSADDVFFDANSGAGTATVGVTVNCANLNFTGYVGTFAGGSFINCYGSLTIAAAMTWTNTSPIRFLATSGSHTITTAGKILGLVSSNDMTFNGSGATWTLQDNLTYRRRIIFQAGTLNFSGYDVTCVDFQISGTGTKVLNMGSGTLTLTTQNAGISSFIVADTTNLTLNAGMSTIESLGTGNSPTFNVEVGGYTFHNIIINTNLRSGFITGSFAANNVSAGASTVILTGNTTINTLTVDTATIQSSVSGTPRTLTIGSADIKRATISDITVAPQVIKAKNSFDAGGNTNINFVDVPANLATTVVTPTNRTTTPSAIINSTTTNVTIHGT